jgi:hypothetical protein
VQHLPAKLPNVPKAHPPHVPLDLNPHVADLPYGPVLLDAGYANDTQLRTSVRVSGLSYVAGIRSDSSVWAQGAAPLPPAEIASEPLVDSTTPHERIEHDDQGLKREFGLGPEEGRAGAASITTPACVSRPMDSWSPSRRGYTRGRLAPTQRQAFCHPPVSDPAAVSLRPGQHVPDSIATVRRCLTVALPRSLERCPCCALRETTAPAAAVACDAVLLRGWHGTRHPCSGVTHFLRASLRCSLGPVGAARARRP